MITLGSKINLKSMTLSVELEELNAVYSSSPLDYKKEKEKKRKKKKIENETTGIL